MGAGVIIITSGQIIWHKATSLPQTDGTFVFARWRQCALTQPKRHLDRFSHFCTVDVRMLSCVSRHALLILVPSHGWYLPPSNMWFFGSTRFNIPRRHLNQFLHRWLQCSVSLYFTMGRAFLLKMALPMGDLDLHLTHGSLGPPVHPNPQPKRHLDRFSSF